MRDCLEELCSELSCSPLVALAAPPGSGKTVLLPVALWEALAYRKVYVLEPRRITARLPALALREVLGSLVGYRIRLEAEWDNRYTKVGYLTYGTALRLFLNQPPGPDDLVIFDEFHERSWEAELLLAYLRAGTEVPRICLMSATLDSEALPCGTPVVTSDGRLHPVEISWEQVEPHFLSHPGSLEALVAQRSAELFVESPGEQLIFLPGLREIRAVAAKLSADSLPGPVDILHSSLSEQEIRRVVERQSEGEFRRILSTDLAESSVTLPGITAVIDAGLVRRPMPDQLELGLTLRTESAPRSSLEQRAGRAGRVKSGRCHRLFTRHQESHRPKFPAPQMEQADYRLVAAVLAKGGLLEQWESLPWLYSPNPERLVGAIAWCTEHGLLEKRALSEKGEWMAEAPVGPRTALFAYNARLAGHQVESLIELCLALEDPPTAREAEPISHWIRVRQRKKNTDKLLADQLRKRLLTVIPGKPRALDEVFAESYADTVAQLGKDRAVCAESEQPALHFHTSQPLNSNYAVLLAARPRSGDGPRSSVALYQEISQETIWECLIHRLEERQALEFDQTLRSVRRISETRLGRLILEREQKPAEPGPEVAAILFENLPQSAPGERFFRTVRRLELFFKSNPEALQEWRETLPELLESEPLSTLLLMSFLQQRTQWTKSSPLELEAHLMSLLPYPLLQSLESLLPTEIRLPGRRKAVEIHYPSQGSPYVESKLQDFFGWTPISLLEGKLALTYHLLAPNGRPCQVTDNLKDFWQGSYQRVRKDLRGRYPKHPWPEDPTIYVHPTK